MNEEPPYCTVQTQDSGTGTVGKGEDRASQTEPDGSTSPAVSHLRDRTGERQEAAELSPSPAGPLPLPAAEAARCREAMTARGYSPSLPSLLREKTCCCSPCTDSHDPPPPPRHAHSSSGAVKRDPPRTPSRAASAGLCLSPRGDACRSRCFSRTPAVPRHQAAPGRKSSLETCLQVTRGAGQRARPPEPRREGSAAAPGRCSPLCAAAARGGGGRMCGAGGGD